MNSKPTKKPKIISDYYSFDQMKQIIYSILDNYGTENLQNIGQLNVADTIIDELMKIPKFPMNNIIEDYIKNQIKYYYAENVDKEEE